MSSNSQTTIANIKESLISFYTEKLSKKHKINIYDYCRGKFNSYQDLTNNRIALTGVLYKNGYANASDAHIALRIKADYKKELEKQLLTRKEM